MRLLRTEEIGGAIVRRKFNLGGEDMLPGTNLAQAVVRAMPTANRNALANAGFMDMWPVQSALDAAAGRASAAEPKPDGAPPDGDLTRYIVPVDGGFDVLEGRRLNVEPLKKADARKLAAGAAAETPDTQH